MYLLLFFGLFASGFTVIYKTIQFIAYIWNTQKTLFIVRGLPGSGKTTWINKVINKKKLREDSYSICSSDDFFIEDNKYNYNPRELPKAHSACLTEFILSIQANIPFIFLNNTNAQGWEYENYVYLAENKGYKIKVIEIECPDNGYVEYFNRRCKYKVPLSTCNLLRDRWEGDETTHMVIPYESDHEGDSLPYPKRSKKSLDDELDIIEKSNKTNKSNKFKGKCWTLIDNKGKKHI